MKKLLTIAVVCLIGAHGFVYGDGFGIPKNGIRPRIITPNNDGRNDIFYVFYNNPMDSEVNGAIYDIDGAKVTDMVHKAGAAEFSLCWDGKDGSGRAVPSGAYIYQIKSEDSTYNGVVIVAR